MDGNSGGNTFVVGWDVSVNRGWGALEADIHGCLYSFEPVG